MPKSPFQIRARNVGTSFSTPYAVRTSLPYLKTRATTAAAIGQANLGSAYINPENYTQQQQASKSNKPSIGASILQDILGAISVPIAGAEGTIGGLGAAIHSGNIMDMFHTIGHAITSQFNSPAPYSGYNMWSDLISGKDDNWSSMPGWGKALISLPTDFISSVPADIATGGAYLGINAVTKMLRLNDAIKAIGTGAKDIAMTRKIKGLGWSDEHTQEALNAYKQGSLKYADLSPRLGRVGRRIKTSAHVAGTMFVPGYGWSGMIKQKWAKFINNSHARGSAMKKSAGDYLKIKTGMANEVLDNGVKHLTPEYHQDLKELNAKTKPYTDSIINKHLEGTKEYEDFQLKQKEAEIEHAKKISDLYKNNKLNDAEKEPFVKKLGAKRDAKLEKVKEGYKEAWKLENMSKMTEEDHDAHIADLDKQAEDALNEHTEGLRKLDAFSKRDPKEIRAEKEKLDKEFQGIHKIRDTQEKYRIQKEFEAHANEQHEKIAHLQEAFGKKHQISSKTSWFDNLHDSKIQNTEYFRRVLKEKYNKAMDFMSKGVGTRKEAFEAIKGIYDRLAIAQNHSHSLNDMRMPITQKLKDLIDRLDPIVAKKDFKAKDAIYDWFSTMDPEDKDVNDLNEFLKSIGVTPAKFIKTGEAGKSKELMEKWAKQYEDVSAKAKAGNEKVLSKDEFIEQKIANFKAMNPKSLVFDGQGAWLWKMSREEYEGSFKPMINMLSEINTQPAIRNLFNGFENAGLLDKLTKMANDIEEKRSIFPTDVDEKNIPESGLIHTADLGGEGSTTPIEPLENKPLKALRDAMGKLEKNQWDPNHEFLNSLLKQEHKETFKKMNEELKDAKAISEEKDRDYKKSFRNLSNVSKELTDYQDKVLATQVKEIANRLKEAKKTTIIDQDAKNFLTGEADIGGLNVDTFRNLQKDTDEVIRSNVALESSRARTQNIYEKIDPRFIEERLLEDKKSAKMTDSKWLKSIRDEEPRATEGIEGKTLSEFRQNLLKEKKEFDDYYEGLEQAKTETSEEEREAHVANYQKNNEGILNRIKKFGDKFQKIGKQVKTVPKTLSDIRLEYRSLLAETEARMNVLAKYTGGKRIEPEIKPEKTLEEKEQDTVKRIRAKHPILKNVEGNNLEEIRDSLHTKIQNIDEYHGRVQDVEEEAREVRDREIKKATDFSKVHKTDILNKHQKLLDIAEKEPRKEKKILNSKKQDELKGVEDKSKIAEIEKKYAYQEKSIDKEFIPIRKDIVEKRDKELAKEDAILEDKKASLNKEYDKEVQDKTNIIKKSYPNIDEDLKNEKDYKKASSDVVAKYRSFQSRKTEVTPKEGEPAALEDSAEDKEFMDDIGNDPDYKDALKGIEYSNFNELSNGVNTKLNRIEDVSKKREEVSPKKIRENWPKNRKWEIEGLTAPQKSAIFQNESFKRIDALMKDNKDLPKSTEEFSELQKTLQSLKENIDDHMKKREAVTSMSSEEKRLNKLKAKYPHIFQYVDRDNLKDFAEEANNKSADIDLYLGDMDTATDDLAKATDSGDKKLIKAATKKVKDLKKQYKSSLLGVDKYGNSPTRLQDAYSRLARDANEEIRKEQKLVERANRPPEEAPAAKPSKVKIKIAETAKKVEDKFRERALSNVSFHAPIPDIKNALSNYTFEKFLKDAGIETNPNSTDKEIIENFAKGMQYKSFMNAKNFEEYTKMSEAAAKRNIKNFKGAINYHELEDNYRAYRLMQANIYHKGLNDTLSHNFKTVEMVSKLKASLRTESDMFKRTEDGEISPALISHINQKYSIKNPSTALSQDELRDIAANFNIKLDPFEPYMRTVQPRAIKEEGVTTFSPSYQEEKSSYNLSDIWNYNRVDRSEFYREQSAEMEHLSDEGLLDPEAVSITNKIREAYNDYEEKYSISREGKESYSALKASQDEEKRNLLLTFPNIDDKDWKEKLLEMHSRYQKLKNNYLEKELNDNPNLTKLLRFKKMAEDMDKKAGAWKYPTLEAPEGLHNHPGIVAGAKNVNRTFNLANSILSEVAEGMHSRYSQPNNPYIPNKSAEMQNKSDLITNQDESGRELGDGTISNPEHADEDREIKSAADIAKEYKDETEAVKKSSIYYQRSIATSQNSINSFNSLIEYLTSNELISNESFPLETNLDKLMMDFNKGPYKTMDGMAQVLFAGTNNLFRKGTLEERKQWYVNELAHLRSKLGTKTVQKLSFLIKKCPDEPYLLAAIKKMRAGDKDMGGVEVHFNHVRMMKQRFKNMEMLPETAYKTMIAKTLGNSSIMRDDNGTSTMQDFDEMIRGLDDELAKNKGANKDAMVMIDSQMRHFIENTYSNQTATFLKTITNAVNKIMGVWKSLSLMTSGYFIRNFVGNKLNALAKFGGNPGHFSHYLREEWTFYKGMKAWRNKFSIYSKRGQKDKLQNMINLFNSHEFTHLAFSNEYNFDRARWQKLIDKEFDEKDRENVMKVAEAAHHGLLDINPENWDKEYEFQNQERRRLGFGKITNTAANKHKIWQNYIDAGSRGAAYFTAKKFKETYLSEKANFIDASRFHKNWGEAEDLGNEDQVQQKASALAKFIHFDYNNLTPFEQKFMTNFIPFYTWQRKNLQFQLRNSLYHPAMANTWFRLASDTQQSMGLNPMNSPDSMVEYGYLPVFKKDNHLTLMKFNAPITDMYAILSPNVLSRINPIFTSAITAISGKDFATGNSLTDYTSGGLMPTPIRDVVNNLIYLAHPKGNISSDPDSPWGKFINNRVLKAGLGSFTGRPGLALSAMTGNMDYYSNSILSGYDLNKVLGRHYEEWLTAIESQLLKKHLQQFFVPTLSSSFALARNGLFNTPKTNWG